MWNEGDLLLVFFVKCGWAFGRWSLLGQGGICAEIVSLTVALLLLGILWVEILVPLRELMLSCIPVLRVRKCGRSPLLG